MKQHAHVAAALLMVWLAAGCGQSHKKPQGADRPIAQSRGVSEPVADDAPQAPSEQAPAARDVAAGQSESEQSRMPDEDTPPTGDDESMAPVSAAEAPDDAMSSAQDDDFDLFEEGIQEQLVEVKDPLEGLNRVVFKFNDMVYTVLLEPLAKTYEGIVSEPVRVGVDNFFENLTTPARYVNCLLQGKGQGADIELRRFWINSTQGILGFGNPARDKYGLEPVREDLGQTLAVWGLGDGFYLVLPILGPSTLRDSAGMVGDYFLNPVSWVHPSEVRYGVTGLRHVNKGSFHIGEYKALVGDAVDPYILVRQSYAQYRARLIKE